MRMNNSIIGQKLAVLLQSWQAPSYQNFDWAVACFAAGIAIYFSLPFEPKLTFLVIGIGVGALILSMAHKFRSSLYIIVLIVFLLLLGCGRAAWHSAAVKEPKLPAYERSYDVTGWIESVEKSGNGFRWQIRVHSLSRLDAAAIPKRVRFRAKTDGFDAGDGVSIRAILSAPPGPVVPDGYDPARRAFYQQIGGYGFAIGKPTAAEVVARSTSEQYKRALVRFRYGLADRIRAKAPPETAGLQAALMTGVRSYIPEIQTEHLRVAGLAHVLAISGLHMGLLAGGSYFVAALLLAMIAPLSRRYDIRKPAAIIGACVATLYLILSGGSVATQRAYIMAIIVFLAVILGRRAFSMRSVSVAALITLGFHPESLISVGFQMSFAAVAALVVVYREWTDKRGYRPRKGLWQTFLSWLSTLTVTSFVAGTATSGFAVLHFHRIANYSLFGNLFAMPIFTFLVMPAALAALVVMPFGLEAVPLAVMGWGLSVLLKVASWVAAWPGAILHVWAAPAWIIGVFGLAFLLATLGSGLRRFTGFAIAALCFVVWSQTPRPDMRVSDSGQVAFWDGDEEDILYVGRKRSDRYGREQFMQKAGLVKSDIRRYQDDLASCDKLACRFEVKGQRVSIVHHPSEVPLECDNADIVILTQRRAGPRARRGCAAALLDQKIFRTSGAHDVYISGEGIELRPANKKGRRARPWS